MPAQGRRPASTTSLATSQECWPATGWAAALAPRRAGRRSPGRQLSVSAAGKHFPWARPTVTLRNASSKVTGTDGSVKRSGRGGRLAGASCREASCCTHQFAAMSAAVDGQDEARRGGNGGQILRRGLHLDVVTVVLDVVLRPLGLDHVLLGFYDDSRVREPG